MSTTLLDVRDLSVVFTGRRRGEEVRAVDDVSLAVADGETLGLVGESGSGKSTIGRAIAGLVPVTSGSIKLDGSDITHLGQRARRRLSSELQVVFQDPYSSLSPTRTIGATLAEVLEVQPSRPQAAEIRARVSSMLDRVGLTADAADRYPSEFSGGQRQRIAIARALMANPRFVICDEPVSALDLSVQAQVLNLLGELQSEFRLSYLFIAHDLAVVRHLSHRIVVLYRGQVMEHGSAEVVYSAPMHPYTQALIEAAPVADPAVQRGRRAQQMGADRTRESALGCPFAPRCSFAIDRCRMQRPKLEQTPAGNVVACHRWREIDAAATDQDVAGALGSAAN
jgi:oligopeptide/dipeptide ABC transporter ATP-binding protein